MLSKEEIKKSSKIAVENARPIIEKRVIEDSLFYRALKALDIKPIEVVIKQRKKRSKRGKRGKAKL